MTTTTYIIVGILILLGFYLVFFPVTNRSQRILRAKERREQKALDMLRSEQHLAEIAERQKRYFPLL